MCHDFHTSNVHQLKIQKQYKYFDNQEYMTLTQYIIKKILSFLRTKISLKTKNGSRPHDRSIEITTQMLHSFHAQFKMRQKQ
jgi:hypothetical protein